VDYIEIQLTVRSEAFVEILEAELSELPFDSFLQEPLKLHAYITKEAYTPEDVANVLASYREEIVDESVKEIPHQNWNAVWESAYEPVFIGTDILIKAPFHQTVPNRDYTILLEPNMSFGTGHHPTTAMILEAMATIDLDKKNVCDFGCGSGILSIYASLRGAHGIGVEIDDHATEAAIKNLQLNSIETFEFLTGDLALLQSRTETFDILLANINRNVIEESMHVFYNKLQEGGLLFCAGFLDSDADELSEALQQTGFETIHRQSQGGWTMLLTKRK